MMDYEYDKNENDIDFTFYVDPETMRKYQEEIAKAIGVPIDYFHVQPEPITPPDDNGPKVFDHEMVTDLEFKMMMGDL